MGLCLEIIGTYIWNIEKHRLLLNRNQSTNIESSMIPALPDKI